MYIGSPVYIVSLLLPCLILYFCWRVLRKKSEKVQKIVILLLAGVNVFQHFFKSVLYPHLFGEGFTLSSTAYNVCACIILLIPVAVCAKSRSLKTFCMCVGACSGLFALMFPVWFLGMDVSKLGWEYGRFLICHSLLFLTCGLHLALELHKISYKDFWKMGFYFLLILCIILLNNTLCIVAGLFPGWSAENLYEALKSSNPFSMMGPREGYDSITSVITALSPSVFLTDNPAHTYVPILWYAIPLYLVISVAAFGVLGFVDRKNLKKDIKMLITEYKIKNGR